RHWLGLVWSTWPSYASSSYAVRDNGPVPRHKAFWRASAAGQQGAPAVAQDTLPRPADALSRQGRGVHPCPELFRQVFVDGPALSAWICRQPAHRRKELRSTPQIGAWQYADRELFSDPDDGLSF